MILLLKDFTIQIEDKYILSLLSTNDQVTTLTKNILHTKFSFHSFNQTGFVEQVFKELRNFGFRLNVFFLQTHLLLLHFLAFLLGS